MFVLCRGNTLISYKRRILKSQGFSPAIIHRQLVKILGFTMGIVIFSDAGR
jgi:hypothetical protein